MSFSSALNIDNNALRIRSFTMAGQQLKVRVPLVHEVEEMTKRVENALWEEEFNKIAEPFKDKKAIAEGEVIKFIDDDIFVDGNSLKQMAQMSAKTKARVLEMFKLLVPAIDFDMSQLTYEMIEEEYPFSIQLEISKKIAEVISPGYEETRKN